MADKTKSNKDPIKAAVDSNPCGSCRAMGLPGCKGHGGSGGGGGGGGSDSNESKKEEAGSKVIGAPSPTALAATAEQDKAKVMWVQSQLLSNVTSNYEVGLLLIESDRLRGNLTFKVKPGLSKVEEGLQTKYKPSPVGFKTIVSLRQIVVSLPGDSVTKSTTRTLIESELTHPF